MSTDLESDNFIIQDNNPELTARVCVTFSMQRNLGDYENCHFSVRYEQSCKPEDKQALTEILDNEARKFIIKKSMQVDEYLNRKAQRKNESKSQT
jgi:hypothetical protein